MNTLAAPLLSSAFAIHSPMPDPPPVITKTRSLTEKRSATEVVAMVLHTVSCMLDLVGSREVISSVNRAVMDVFCQVHINYV